MTSWATNGVMIVLGTLATVALPISAQAHTHRSSPVHTTAHASTAHHGAGAHATRGGRYAMRHGRHGLVRYASAGISCVPFARAETGIALTGNAATWWDEAEGRYARGQAPEQGSILNFRANASMHLGHVAVVRNVVNSRQIEIDQANWWGPGGGHGVVSRDIAVVDVSAHNDWTAVRVALGHSGSFGSVYPTYGFIYHRADGSDPAPQVIMASATGTQLLNPAPRDLRSRRDRTRLAAVRVVNPNAAYDEVAEAPADAAASGPLTLDAPDRTLR